MAEEPCCSDSNSSVFGKSLKHALDQKFKVICNDSHPVAYLCGKWADNLADFAKAPNSLA